tara:strand:+ start:375 stop:719 length:345 start_codon:yes stop_codon:yes gene_type:complete
MTGINPVTPSMEQLSRKVSEIDPTVKSAEIRNRIRLSVAAYAYEIKDEPVMSDSDFDELSKKIDLDVSTGNRKMDNFFKKHFEPDTGMWIRKHPELDKLDWIYEKFFKGKLVSI